VGVLGSRAEAHPGRPAGFRRPGVEPDDLRRRACAISRIAPAAHGRGSSEDTRRRADAPAERANPIREALRTRERLRVRGERLDSILFRGAVAADIPTLAGLHVTTWTMTRRRGSASRQRHEPQRPIHIGAGRRALWVHFAPRLLVSEA